MLNDNCWKIVFEGEVVGAEEDLVSGDKEADDWELWEMYSWQSQGVGAWDQEWWRCPNISPNLTCKQE